MRKMIRASSIPKDGTTKGVLKQVSVRGANPAPAPAPPAGAPPPPPPFPLPASLAAGRPPRGRPAAPSPLVPGPLASSPPPPSSACGAGLAPGGAGDGGSLASPPSASSPRGAARRRAVLFCGVGPALGRMRSSSWRQDLQRLRVVSCAAAALRLHGGLVCSCRLRPVGYRLERWRMFPPAWRWYFHFLSMACASRFGQSCSACHGDTTRTASIPWWRLLVGGKMGGALRIVRGCGVLGVGRNLCHLDTDAVTFVGVASPS